MAKLDEALKRVLSTRASARRRGYLELLAMGEKDRVLQAALAGNDESAIDVACDAFFPEPPELLRVLIEGRRGRDASLLPRFHLPMGNYLYAEPLIVEHYGGKGKRIAVDAIVGLGLAYMRGMAPAFQKLLGLPIANAIEELRPPERPTFFPDKYDRPLPGHDHLSMDGLRVLEAVMALHRLDHPVAAATLDRIDKQVEASLATAEWARRAWKLKLQWARFDAGHNDDLTGLIAGMAAAREIAPDLATTLLKRGRSRDLDLLFAEFDPVYFLPRGFIDWPLANTLEARGLRRFVMPPPERILVVEDSYARARQKGLAPPPWWSWQ